MLLDDPLKKIPVQELEQVIADAISNRTGETYRCTLSSAEFHLARVDVRLSLHQELSLGSSSDAQSDSRQNNPQKKPATGAVLFSNNQWVVTDWGLTTKHPPAPYAYDIEANRLLETAGAGHGHYNWPAQLYEKNWIDMPAFEEACAKAVEIHHSAAFDPAKIEESFRYARSLPK